MRVDDTWLKGKMGKKKKTAKKSTVSKKGTVKSTVAKSGTVKTPKDILPDVLKNIDFSEYLKTFQRVDDCPYDDVPNDLETRLNCFGGQKLKIILKKCENYENCLAYKILKNNQMQGKREGEKKYCNANEKNNEESRKTGKIEQNEQNGGRSVTGGYICGAKLQGKDKICRKPVKDGERCHKHSGGALKKTGANHHTVHAGSYAKYAVGTMKKYLEEMAMDQIQSLDEELALLKALTARVTEELDTIQEQGPDAEAEGMEEASGFDSDKASLLVKTIKTMAEVQRFKYDILEKSRGMVTLEISNLWIKTIMKVAFGYINSDRRADFTAEVKDRLKL